MIYVLIMIGIIALVMLVSAVDCALHIDVAEYSEPVTGIESPIKIVCMSDLHGWSYGKDNCKLLALTAAQKPDVIIFAGDIITRRATEKQVSRMLDLLVKLAEIAPVYFATGNHEVDYMAEKGMDLLEDIADTGVTVLYDSFTEVQIGGNMIRIGAASGRYFDGSERDNAALQMLEEIGKDDTPSIAVVHQPENIFKQEKRSAWTADLYLGGHTHGGVWRIPGLGGVMSPGEGLFPKYDRGRFVIDDKMPLILNGGLSGYYFIPRVFNRPEICVIKLFGKG